MRGLWAGQVAIAVGTMLVIASATLLPFNSPMPPSPLTTPESQASNAVTKLLWLAAVLVARASAAQPALEDPWVCLRGRGVGLRQYPGRVLAVLAFLRD
jgi:hypothetical protein